MFPGADVESDYDMVTMTFLEKLNDLTMMSAIHATIGGRFAPLATLVDKDADVDAMVPLFKKVVTDTATERTSWQKP